MSRVPGAQVDARGSANPGTSVEPLEGDGAGRESDVPRALREAEVPVGRELGESDAVRKVLHGNGIAVTSRSHTHLLRRAGTAPGPPDVVVNDVPTNPEDNCPDGRLNGRLSKKSARVAVPRPA